MVIRSLVGGEGGLNARVVIEITVAMNNEKEEGERRACASLYDHITHFSGGAKPADATDVQVMKGLALCGGGGGGQGSQERWRGGREGMEEGVAELE